MGKRRYKAVWVKDFVASKVKQRIKGRVVVAIDVAKEEFYAAIMDESRTVLETVKWKHPEKSRSFVRLVRDLAADGVLVDVAMEPSGVYGDAVRSALWDAGLQVYRVSPKRSHDAAEVYDGVPSWHDAKSAAIIGKLHLDGASEPWPVASEHERTLTAALRVLEVHEKEYQRNRNRLEGHLARHWPELPDVLDLGSATLLELLMAYGGPCAVASDADGARGLMRRVGGRFLAAEKVDKVVAAALSTFGMPQIEEERQMVMKIAAEARRQQRASKKARRRVEALSMAEGATQEMAPVVGKTTAAVLVAGVGDPLQYASAAAYEKALGLNLKEKSSGKHQGALHITKRGPGVARLFLYMAVLRRIHSDEVFRAWYTKKVGRDGGRKLKAVVALMRKLARALWYVARGRTFDARLLFDVRRLGLANLTASAEALW